VTEPATAALPAPGTGRARLLGWLTGLALLLPALATLVSLLNDPEASGRATRFESAQRWIEPLPAGVALADIVRLPPPPADARWEDVALPDMMTRKALIDLPRGKPLRAWFRVRYEAPADLAPGEALMFYVPRLMVGEYQLWVNGEPVANNVNDWRKQWNRPIAVRLPASQRTLDVMLATPFHPEVGYALSRIRIGPEAAIQPMVSSRIFWQSTLLQASSLVALLMGMVSLHFWWKRRSEDQHLLLALMSLAWWVWNLRLFVDLPDSNLVMAWHLWLTDAAVWWIIVLAYLFAFRFDERRFPRVEKALLYFVVAATLLTLPIWPWQSGGSSLMHWASGLVSVLVTAMLSWLALRGGRIEIKLLCLALWLCIGFGFHDILLLERRLSPEHLFLFAYSCVFIFAAFEFAVQRRYLAALDDQERMSASLAERLAQRQAELEDSYRLLRDNEREQTLLLERQRLMADMHDGLGSALLSSLAMVEQGKLAQGEVAGILRHCIDDMRLMIDALAPENEALGDLLAELRYRLEPRLAAVGIRLEWDVAALPAMEWMSPAQRLDTLRIVQEALTNCLKHADSHRVRLEARVADGAVALAIADSGRGFDVAVERRLRRHRGVESLYRRAGRVGGELSLESVPGQGTTVTLRLPLRRVADARH
jgi:signal transduction histidine kinase